MATDNEIKTALELFHELRPQKTFSELNKNDIGLFAVMRYLHETGHEVRSKDISAALGMSSARMAILLKKLVAKNWIVKSAAKNDARAISVAISDEGQQVITEMKNKMFITMGKLIDEFGFEELKLLIVKMSRIRDIMCENDPCQ